MHNKFLNKKNLVLKRESLLVPIKTETRLPRLIIDQDDVLALLVPKLIEIHNNRYGTKFTIEDCTDFHLEDCFGDTMCNILFEQGLFLSLEPVPNAIETLKRLYESGRYDIRIVTAATPQSFIEKLQWLQKYAPFFPSKYVIPCSVKESVWGDILLDDGIHNILGYEGIGEAVIFDMPHNRNVQNKKRVYNWLEFEEYIESKFYL